ncbi:hypothetical protein [Clostridium sp. JNZ J1-5]
MRSFIWLYTAAILAEVINERRLERSVKKENIAEFFKVIETEECLNTEVDEKLWKGTIEKVIVNAEDKIIFVFKDSMEHLE